MKKILLTILILLLIIGAYFLYLKLLPKESPALEDDEEEVLTEGVEDWLSYNYSSYTSIVLPDIGFEYPAFFGEKPTLIFSRSEVTDADWKWGGFVEFNPNKKLNNGGIRLEFFNERGDFDEFIEEYKSSGDWDSIKYFKAGDYQVARVRAEEIGQYFIKLKYDNRILLVSTKGDKRFLNDEDINGLTTRDKIVSSIRFLEIKKGEIGDLDLYKFAIDSELIIFPGLGQEINRPYYLDLDGDGKEEVVFSIYGGGTGGSFGPCAAKLKDGKAVLIEVEPNPTMPSEIGEWRGHEGVFVIENRLIKGHTIYKPGDANCCPSAGERYILYKWNNSRLEVDKIIYLEPEWVDRSWEEASQEAFRRFKLK